MNAIYGESLSSFLRTTVSCDNPIMVLLTPDALRIPMSYDNATLSQIRNHIYSSLTDVLRTTVSCWTHSVAIVTMQFMVIPSQMFSEPQWVVTVQFNWTHSVASDNAIYWWIPHSELWQFNYMVFLTPMFSEFHWSSYDNATLSQIRNHIYSGSDHWIGSLTDVIGTTS